MTIVVDISPPDPEDELCLNVVDDLVAFCRAGVPPK
jgi:hypothetical protein